MHNIHIVHIYIHIYVRYSSNPDTLKKREKTQEKIEKRRNGRSEKGKKDKKKEKKNYDRRGTNNT